MSARRSKAKSTSSAAPVVAATPSSLPPSPSAWISPTIGGTLCAVLFVAMVVLGSQNADIVHGFDALKSAKLLSGAAVINIAWLDLVKGINACAQYRRVSPQTGRLEALVACLFLRTIGGTLQCIALGTALSWMYSTTAIPTVLVAWLAICCTPLDTVLAFVSRPQVRIVLDVAQNIATAHTITTSAMEAVFVAPGFEKSILAPVVIACVAAYGSRILGDYYNISEPPGSKSIAWVPDHVPVDFVTPSSTVRRATFCAVLYLLLRNVHNIVPVDPWFWLLPGSRNSELIADGGSARVVVASVLVVASLLDACDGWSAFQSNKSKKD